MGIYPIIKRVGLSIPQLRRLHSFAYEQWQCRVKLQSECEALRAKCGSLEAEHNSLEEKNEELDLQLYVLRSDCQRAVARNERLADTLRKAEERIEELNKRATNASGFSEFYAKLAGQITMLRSEMISKPNTSGGEVSVDGAKLYLDLIEDALTGTLWGDKSIAPWQKEYDPEIRASGRDWPEFAQTMIGSARLRNLRMLCEQVVLNSVPGDFLEAGVWRGGACILMRAVLLAFKVSDRQVWVADSFDGLPVPDEEKYPFDKGDQHSAFSQLAVDQKEVEENFRRYNLLDNQVRFIKGWFKDTLHLAPIEKLAVLRLDGDMYESTIETLDALYAKVSIGGVIIVDDYILPACRQAVDDFRAKHAISDPLRDVDGAAVYWYKS